MFLYTSVCTVASLYILYCAYIQLSIPYIIVLYLCMDSRKNVPHSTSVPVWCGNDGPGTLDIEVGPEVGQHQLVEVGREAVSLLGGRPVQLVATAATAASGVEAPGHAT